MANDPQVPWSDEQWARANQVVQEEAKRARVAATFLPLYGPLDADADFVRKQDISYSVSAKTHDAAVDMLEAALQQSKEALDRCLPYYAAAAAAQERIARAQTFLGLHRLGIDDRDTVRLATLQVTVRMRNAQLADPEMTSVLAMLRRAANVVARLEDAVVFRGLASDPTNPGRLAPQGGLGGMPLIWQITGAEDTPGLWSPAGRRLSRVRAWPEDQRGHQIVAAVSGAIGDLERDGTSVHSP